MITVPMPLFSLGQVVATPACLEQLQKANQSATPFLHRHQHGDWGNISQEDRQLNEQALSDGSRLMSVYSLDTGVAIWIITDAAEDEENVHKRSVTTCLLPSDY